MFFVILFGVDGYYLHYTMILKQLACTCIGTFPTKPFTKTAVMIRFEIRDLNGTAVKLIFYFG